ncbi:MAG: RnfABCDGE type electron transport complex subunit B [Lachnospiraceae bacterium]|nr:RnfABCDGE type electron transport complex subunit B [Lachnospiraceae bacterium]
MSTTGVLLAMAIVGATGCFIGFFLCIASEKLAVEVDERETAILDVLPGNNCGGCGYAGCSGLAAAIVAGEAPVNGCPVGGDPVAQKVGAIMGVDAEGGNRQVAFVKCAGTCDKAKNNYDYAGIKDCSAMAFVPGGGPKTCDYGCMGFGSCVKACPFDAIHIIDGIAKVDREACKACGKCIEACPKHLIEFIPYEAKFAVACSSHDKGREVMAACSTGCIACHLCEKSCNFDAVHVEDNVAHIDQDKCKRCSLCMQKCPKHVIPQLHGKPIVPKAKEPAKQSA